jgi:hypothetical protein
MDDGLMLALCLAAAVCVFALVGFYLVERGD